MSLTLTSPPGSEPVTTAEAKTHARVSTADDDTYIGTLIAAARESCEIEQGKVYITQTWVLRLDAFPSAIIVPKPPLQSVTSIQYVDGAGDSQTLDAGDYQVSIYGGQGRIIPAYGKEWPTTREQLDAVIVTFVAGYGDAASDVPDNVKLAIKMLVSHWYEAREPIIAGTIVAEVPISVAMLLGQRKVVKL